MSNRLMNSTKPAPERRNGLLEGEPLIVVFMVWVFGAGALLCAGLLLPILWSAISGAEQSVGPPTQCVTMVGKPGGKACYDAAFYRTQLGTQTAPIA